MTWKKYFTPVPTGSRSNFSPVGSSSNPGPARANYSSYLPDVYTGSPNRLERYLQYETMDSDPEVNAALDILAEFCTQKLKDGQSAFKINWRHKATNSEVKILSEYLQHWNKLQQFDVTHSSLAIVSLSAILKHRSGFTLMQVRLLRLLLTKVTERSLNNTSLKI
jgi:hypothetical protein